MDHPFSRKHSLKERPLGPGWSRTETSNVGTQPTQPWAPSASHQNPSLLQRGGDGLQPCSLSSQTQTQKRGRGWVGSWAAWEEDLSSRSLSRWKGTPPTQSSPALAALRRPSQASARSQEQGPLLLRAPKNIHTSHPPERPATLSPASHQGIQNGL